MTASTTTLQISLSQALKTQLCQYLKTYTKFASIISISISPTSNVLFSVVNESNSCYSSLLLHASRLARQLPSDQNPDNAIFLQAYRQPLKPFLHHLQRSSQAELMVLEFTPFSLNFKSELSEGIQSVWRSNLSPGPIQNPIYGARDGFPVCVSGFSVDWFQYLMEGVSTSTLLTKATLVLKTSANSGLQLVLPGKNRAEIDVGAFNFGSFRSDSSFSIAVSLREMAALMNLAANLNSLIDMYFGPSGCPLVASLSSIGMFDCTFVMATLSLENAASDAVENAATEQEEHVSGTDEE